MNHLAILYAGDFDGYNYKGIDGYDNNYPV